MDICSHKRLHPGRTDQATTICLDCKSVVHIAYVGPVGDRDDLIRVLKKLGSTGNAADDLALVSR